MFIDCLQKNKARKKPRLLHNHVLETVLDYVDLFELGKQAKMKGFAVTVVSEIETVVIERVVQTIELQACTKHNNLIHSVTSKLTHASLS